MCSKLIKIRAAVLSCNYDVIVLIETWLHDGISDAEILPSSEWFLIRRDRHASSTNSPLSRPKKGGGVLIAVRRSIITTKIDSSDFPGEHVWAEIRLPQKRIVVGAAYVPPDGTVSDYNSIVDAAKSISQTLQAADDIFIFGDFNLSALQWVHDDDNPVILHPVLVHRESEKALIDGFQSLHMFQVCEVKTVNQLDLVFCNVAADLNIQPAQHPLDHDSHHHKSIELVYFLHTYATQNEPEEDAFYYDFNAANYVQINNELRNINWSQTLSADDPNAAATTLQSILEDIIAKHVPRKRKKKRRSCPWMNDLLANLRNRRNRAHRSFTRSPTPINLARFTKLRDDFAEAYASECTSYYNLQGKKLKNDPRSFWRFINAHRKNSGLPKTMKLGSSHSYDAKSSAELLRQHFQSCYLTGDPPVNEFNLPKLVELSEISISQEDVLKNLQSLDLNKGPGPDGIPTKFLRETAETLCAPLHAIFTLSLTSGIFPTLWKISFITPVFKGGNSADAANYRPIAILSAIPKLFEKLITDLLTPLLLDKLHVAQHGFGEGKSTLSNLLVYSKHLYDALKDGDQVDSIYTDFTKAFDRVNHQLLLTKLKSIGITGTFHDWIGSYLGQRTQHVRVENAVSEPVFGLSGVPQGSHLGPLLFLLFINDLCDVLEGCEFLLYADDLKIFSRVKSMDDCTLLQNNLDKVAKWCTDNGMELNARKCEVISFKRNKPNESLVFDYQIDQCLLRRVHVIRDLGVYFDSKLSFEYQRDIATSKATMMLGFVKRQSKHFQCPYTVKSLFCALVRSILEYCSVIWAPYTQCSMSRIESVQKRFLLYALRHLAWADRYNMPPYEARLMLLNLQAIRDRYEVAQSMVVFDLLSKKMRCPSLLQELDFGGRSTRNGTRRLAIAGHSTNFMANEPFNRCCTTFNRFSEAYEPVLSRDTFKKRILSLIRSRTQEVLRDRTTDDL